MPQEFISFDTAKEIHFQKSANWGIRQKKVGKIPKRLSEASEGVFKSNLKVLPSKIKSLPLHFFNEKMNFFIFYKLFIRKFILRN